MDSKTVPPHTQDEIDYFVCHTIENNHEACGDTDIEIKEQQSCGCFKVFACNTNIYGGGTTFSYKCPWCQDYFAKHAGKVAELKSRYKQAMDMKLKPLQSLFKTWSAKAKFLPVEKFSWPKHEISSPPSRKKRRGRARISRS